ncbi:MG321/MPN456 family lipoprotein [Ureaplasma ceti]|uniref:MG321/MPN456 family lipoprotein n=1 Tax=Ureaplasma ceti TaxID=3119530 RepID=UPI003340E347
MATPLLGLLAIASDSRAPQATSTYLMNFKAPMNQNEGTQSFERSNDNFAIDTISPKQKYINDLERQVSEVFKQYKQEHKEYKGLTLDYINLKASPTPGEVSFFEELNKTLKAINPNLSFNMIQRSPSTVQQGFYQQNADMISMIWSPDYNDVGTWLTYMFQDQQIANLWPAVAAAMNHKITVVNETMNVEHKSWVDNLRNYIKKRNFGFKDKNGQFVPLVNKENHVMDMNELMSYTEKGVSSSAIYTSLSNAISAWADSPEAKKYEAVPMDDNDPNLYKDGTYTSFHGGLKSFKASMQTNLMDFLTQYKPNIPYVQDGPNTKTASLVRLGAHAPENINSSKSFRDWYYNPEIYKGDGVFRNWLKGNPFLGNITVLNPSFNKGTNNVLSSTFTNLFSWSTHGDFYNQESAYKSNYGLSLNADGAMTNPKHLEEVIDSGFTDNSFSDIKCGIDKDGSKYVDIPIRPLPWVNYEGNTTNNIHYLSPQDYWAGFKAYERSVSVKLNYNGYFMDLLGLDMNKMLSYPGNQARNTSPEQHKTFRIYFDNPTLSGSDIVDILTKQYFAALPEFSPLVQNITNDQKFESIAHVSQTNGVLNISDNKLVDMSKFYGCGFYQDPNVWKQLWSVGPYTVNQINTQQIVFKINKHYFGQSVENPGPWKDVADNPNYCQNFLNGKITIQKKIEKDGKFTGKTEPVELPIKKFDEVKSIYSSAYNVQLAYEQFKINELDESDIPTAKLAETYANPTLSKEVYQKSTLKLDKSNLIPYNLRVLEVDGKGTIKLFDKNDKEVPFSDKYVSMDKYGNYVFKDGYHPKVKSKISDGYYDLIVKNFFTPIDATGPDGKLLPAIDRSSAIIRTAINDCINWFALTSIIDSGKSQVIQNSFMPYGVDNLSDDISNSRLTYWSLAIYKVTTEMNPEFEKPGKRLGGITEWTWPEYINVWKAHLKSGE